MSNDPLLYMATEFMTTINSLCRSNDFKSAVNALNELKTRILNSYYIQNSPDYHPAIIKYLLKSLIPLMEYKKYFNFSESLDSFLKHMLSLAISSCPKLMTHTLPTLVRQLKTPVVYQYTTSYFAFLISGYLPYDKAVLYIDDLYSMIFSTPPHYLENIPESTLFLLLNHKSEDDIMALILIFSNSNNIRALQILITKNTDKLLPAILLSAPPKTISKILSCVSDENLKKLDVVPVLARLNDLVVEELPVKINYTLSSLKKLVPYINDTHINDFKPILNNIYKKLKEVPDFNTKHKYLSVLVECENHQLIKLEEFEQYLENPNPSCLKEILELYTNILNRNDNLNSHIKDKYFDILKKITSYRNKRSLGRLIKLFTNESEKLKENLGDDNYNFIYSRLFYPLPYEEKVQSLIIDLLIKNNDLDKFKEIVYDLIEYQSLEHSKDYIKKLKSAIEDHFHIAICPSKLDWFGQYSYQYFAFVEKGISASFYEEYLEAKFFKPKDTSYLLAALKENSKTVSPYAFKQACTALRTALQVIGYKNKWNFSSRNVDINSIQNPDTNENHWWFSTDELDKLFNKINGETIGESPFGIIVSNIVDLIIVMKETYSELDGSIIIFLTLCARFLKVCMPKAACRLLSSVFDDVKNKSRIKNFDEARQKIYETEFELFFDSKENKTPRQSDESSERSEKSDKNDVFGSFDKHTDSGELKATASDLNEIFSGYQIHFNASPDFVKLFLKCFGKEKLFEEEKIKPFVRDAITKDAEIAQMFQSYFNQPLPLMPTFTYFTDEKHKEWAEVCKTKIPKSDWILLPEKIDQSKIQQQQQQQKLVKYEFVQPEIEEGPQMHPLEPKTKYGVISFLFHSDRKSTYSFLNKEKLEEIEKYIFDHSNPKDKNNDPRLILGYISFVMSHGMNLDVLKWIPKIEPKDRKDKLSTYASALLLEAVRIKTNLSDKQEVVEFSERVLDVLGIYDHSPQSIVRAFEENINTIDDYHYRRNNGTHLSSFEWLFVRSVIGLNILKYEQFSPIRITAEFSDIANGDKVINYGLQLLERDQTFTGMANFVSALSYLYIGNTRNRHFWIGKCRYNYLLPSNSLYHSVFVLFDLAKLNEAQKPIDYGKGMTELILKSFKSFQYSKTKTIPFCTEIFLTMLASTDREYREIIQLIKLKVGHNPDLLMHNTYTVDDPRTSDSVIIEALNFRPPSEVRKFYRCLLKHLVESNRLAIRKTMDRIINTKLDHYNVPPPTNKRNLNINDRNCESSLIVFPELCYSGATYFKMIPWNLHDYDITMTNSNYGTFLRLKMFDTETLMGCHFEMLEPNEESVAMFKTISLMTKEDFNVAKAWPDEKSGIHDFATVLLNAAVSERCSVYIADLALRNVTKTMNIEEVAEIVFSKDFLAKGKLANALFIFRKLEKMLVKADLNEIVNKKCKVYHDRSKDMFEGDSARSQAFVNPNSEESVFESLHEAAGEAAEGQRARTAQPAKQEKAEPKHEEPAAQKQEAAPQQEEPAAQEEEAVTQQEEAAAQEEPVTQQEEAAPQQEERAAQEEEAVTQQEEAAPQQEEPAAQQEEAVTQQEEAAPQQEEPAPQQEEATSQQEEPAAQQEEAAAQHEEQAHLEEEAEDQEEQAPEQ